MKEYEVLIKAIHNSREIPPCRISDPDAWFSDKDDGQSQYREAKRLCAVCPVRAECLTYALASDEVFGVWGGLTRNERLKIRPSHRSRLR